MKRRISPNTAGSGSIILLAGFLGYDMGPDHNLMVNPEQAKLVKRIYGMFLLGKSPFQIANIQHIPSTGFPQHSLAVSFLETAVVVLVLLQQQVGCSLFSFFFPNNDIFTSSLDQ